MRTKSSNYDTIFANAAHYAETMVYINGTEYDQSKIFSLSVSENLFGSEYSIGGVVMNQMTLCIKASSISECPKLSRVDIWTRLCVGTGSNKQTTNWLPKGIFYTAKPSFDPISGKLTATGYDEIYKTEVTPWEVGTTVTAWSAPTLRRVAQHLADGTTYSGSLVTSFAGVGIPLEDATQISSSYTMPATPFGYTVREILSDIAKACCGNWTICTKTTTESSTHPVQTAYLRLIPINSIPA